MRTLAAALTVALLLSACGGDGDGAATSAEAPAATTEAADGLESRQPGDAQTVDAGDQAPTEDGGADDGGGISGASATLVVGDQTIEWAGNAWTYCEIGAMFPVNVEFQVEEVKHDGDWFQFIDRGDGGVNFSVVLDGEEYGGTGSGEADEIRDDGFTYTGTLNRGGEVLDTTLDVTC